MNLREYLLSNSTLTLATINRRVKAINQLSCHVDLFDNYSVVKYLNASKWSAGTRNIVVQAYHDYQRMYGLTNTPIKKYHITQQLPFIPLESEIDSLIAGCTARVSVYLSLLKETGMRPIEAWSLLFSDVDTVQHTVNIRTKKHGVARILHISESVVNLLFSLDVKDSKHIFAIGTDPLRFPIELSHFTRNYLDRRREIARNLCNPRILQISLYTFRHWKATMEYLKTRDIFHCMWMLGHSRIANTMKYVSLANAISVDSGSYTAKLAHSEDEACKLIEAGYDYVTDMNNVKIFRKRK